MYSFSLLTTLSTGVISSFLLFFLFYKGLRWNNRMAAVVTILVVLGIYIPLAIWDWAGIDVFAIHFAFFVMTGYGLGIITSHRQNRQRLDAKLGQTAETNTGWFHWAPATIVAFFLTLAMVDATIISLASKGASSEFMARFLPEPQGTSGPISSAFTGPVAHDFKEKYDQFNQHLAQKERQRERGWQIENSWQQTPKVGEPAVFSIKVLDKAGQPVSGAEVEVSFLRPSDRRLDKHFTLPESLAGAYGQRIELDAPGAWTVVVRVRRGEDLHEMTGKTEVAKAG